MNHPSAFDRMGAIDDYPDLYFVWPGEWAITCRLCKNTSFNPKDVEYHFCPEHGYLDDIWPPCREELLNGTYPHLFGPYMSSRDFIKTST